MLSMTVMLTVEPEPMIWLQIAMAVIFGLHALFGIALTKQWPALDYSEIPQWITAIFAMLWAAVPTTLFLAAALE